MFLRYLYYIEKEVVLMNDVVKEEIKALYKEGNEI